MSTHKKQVRQNESARRDKFSIAAENPKSYLSNHPVWAFGRCDISNTKWSIMNCKSLYHDILTKLISFEGLTWSEIQSASGGKRSGNGSNSHFVYISDLIKDAQKRAQELHLNVDQLFSLRLTGTSRLYGILDNGVFYILWYDSNHEIYKAHKT